MGRADRYIPPQALPFRPGTVTWRVNLEPGLVLGGGRALLLQVAHPLVAAGVAQHSDYQSDPWARLARTLDVMFKMAFADRAVSRRQSKTLEATHRRVSGTSSEGVAYRALDPALLVWVWATLVDSALVVYERCYGRLGPIDRERFYQEQKLIAYGCGVPEGACPERLADFESYFAGVVETQLRVTPEAQAVADAISRPPLRRPLGPLAAGPLNLVTAGLLPPSVRHDYGLAWSDERDRLLTAFFGVVGFAARFVPRPLRQLPGLYAVRRTKPLMPPRFLQVQKTRPAQKTTAA
jgi:uncharacterized protein (DUF2236 family)